MGLVAELQKDALDADIGATQLLRKALVVAHKLHLNDFEEWINLELNGYDWKKQNEIPEYRGVDAKIEGFNPYHGWQQISFQDPSNATPFLKRKNHQPISQIEQLFTTGSKSPHLQVPLSAVEQAWFDRNLKPRVQVRRLVSAAHVRAILEAVRNAILKWSLELEDDGIHGDGLSFSSEEMEIATKQQYNINHFHGSATAVQIQQGSDGSAQNMHYETLPPNLSEWIELLSSKLAELSISPDQVSEIQADIDTIRSQQESPNPKTTIQREALSSIRSILESAAGTVGMQLLGLLAS